ncbi:MAG: hypothetical protein KDB23_05345 [Planctomycetales bacterium]|nr:hypothetical protein [Planctomycetales bacterium]
MASSASSTSTSTSKSKILPPSYQIVARFTATDSIAAAEATRQTATMRFVLVLSIAALVLVLD